jgi:hypothetical protein
LNSYSNRVRWNLSVVLICISFIAREVEHFFIYLLVIFLWKFLIQFMHPFLHWDVDSLEVEFYKFSVDSIY